MVVEEQKISNSIFSVDGLKKFINEVVSVGLKPMELSQDAYEWIEERFEEKGKPMIPFRVFDFLYQRALTECRNEGLIV